MTKCEAWPVVLPDDDGIRPAGQHDQCFYCRAKVGQPHSERCVTVTAHVLYGVYVNEKRVGSLKMYEPCCWGVDDLEWARNDGTWCASNAIDEIEWTDEDAKNTAIAADEINGCCCSLLKFKFERTLDNGPFVRMRRDDAVA